MSEQADIETALARATAAYKNVRAERDALKDANDRAEAAEAENERLRALTQRVEELQAVLTRIVRAHDDYVATNPDAVDYPDWLDDEINDARALAKEAGK